MKRILIITLILIILIITLILISILPTLFTISQSNTICYEYSKAEKVKIDLQTKEYIFNNITISEKELKENCLKNGKK